VRFHDRHSELSFLESQARRDRPALVVLYGRRRVGKTEILRRLCASRRAVFFVADATARANQLAAFSAVAFEALGEAALATNAFSDWEPALRFVASRARDEPLLLVLDEFPRLCASDSSLPSVLQRLWDAELGESRLHLVLCGSSLSFMERELLAAKNPLYGRRTGAYRVEPFLFADARHFFPRFGRADQVAAYGVAGGVPAYLELLDDRRPFAGCVIDAVLRKGAPLYDEVQFLLMEELRDVRTYFSICQAIAFGRSTPNEIAQGAGLADRGATSRYLETLRELGVVAHETPATERNPSRSRRGRWALADAFFRFWFRFVLPNRSALEAGDPAAVYRSKVAPQLDQHLGPTFEEICRQHVWAMARGGELPLEVDRVGRWWRGPEEVDVVAVGDGGSLLVGECKWTRRRVGVDVLEELRRRADAVAHELRRTPARVRCAVFARAGFSADLERVARGDETVLLVDLAAICRHR
jgi:AAA+ ATPase superfamily predicted ATPase